MAHAGEIVRSGSSVPAMVSDLDLEELCHACAGGGKEAEDRRCHSCNGKGFIPTDFGEAILVLVQRHSGVIF